MKYEIAALWCLALLTFSGEPDGNWQLALNWALLIVSVGLVTTGLVL